MKRRALQGERIAEIYESILQHVHVRKLSKGLEGKVFQDNGGPEQCLLTPSGVENPLNYKDW